MSKMSKEVKEMQTTENSDTVTNFMGSKAYELNPLETLKMIAASSIFGEPQYYVDGKRSESWLKYSIEKMWFPFLVIIPEKSKTTAEIYEDAIDKALDYDFEATIRFADELRHNYMMRLNPQVIMVRAALHPKRADFNNAHPGLFKEIEMRVMSRADEPATQLTYYLSLNKGNKANIPSILKRSWAEKLESLTPYEVSKYKNHEIGMINTVRVCHASSDVLNELMKNGNVELEADEKTWENYKSEGKTWKEILSLTRVPHMALLRNLKNIAMSLDPADQESLSFMQDVLNTLEKGVLKGKQFPFRYYSAYKRIKGMRDLNYKDLIIESLENCLNISLENMPKLDGKTMVLTDNSGSAWGTLETEFGSVLVAEINNLSAVLTALNSTEGYIGVFGDELEVIKADKNDKVLELLEKVNRIGKNIGMGTETGSYTFFEKAIDNREWYDNVFVYSDMQIGTGGLYGKGINEKEFFDKYNTDHTIKLSDHMSYEYIDLFALLKIYRSLVNSKANVFAIQTAGYKNTPFPGYAYRTTLLYGWTGKESVFAKAMIDNWDEFDKAHTVIPNVNEAL